MKTKTKTFKEDDGIEIMWEWLLENLDEHIYENGIPRGPEDWEWFMKRDVTITIKTK